MANPEPNPSPTLEPEPEPEIHVDGIVEIQGKKFLPQDQVGATIAAERQRVRKVTEEKVRAELQPTVDKAAQADQLAADLNALQPHLAYLQAHPELLQQGDPAEALLPPEQQVSDEEAERFARQYELYTASGLDLARAKRLIRDNRADMTRVAKQVAEDVVKPMRETTAIQASRQNFVWAASQLDADGHPLVKPEELAKLWATFPVELTAQNEIAATILDAAIGRVRRSTTSITRPDREPLHTETPGRIAPTYQISDLERRVAQQTGIQEKQWTDRAKQYQRDTINVLED